MIQRNDDNHKTKIAVTGANGFVGQALCSHLLNAGFLPVAITRRPHHQAGANNCIVSNFTDQTAMKNAMQGCTAAVILASRTHSGTAATEQNLQNYRRDNLATAVSSFKAANEAGVTRLIYLSSIKVNGESTSGIPFSATSKPKPEDAYGITKLETELALRNLADNTGIELTIIRPPLIYGAGVKGNLQKLESAIKRGMPLPLASINNKRALVSLNRLCDFIRVCLIHPKAANRVFLVSDGVSRSISEIVELLGNRLGRKPILFPCPTTVLKLAGFLLGKKTLVSRLASDLEVDISDTCRTLNWHPEAIDFSSELES